MYLPSIIQSRAMVPPCARCGCTASSGKTAPATKQQPRRNLLSVRPLNKRFYMCFPLGTESERSTNGQEARSLPVARMAYESAIHKLLSIAVLTASLLRAAGIVTVRQLQEVGSVEAFVLLRTSDPTLDIRVLWRLESALTNTQIGRITPRRKADLLVDLRERTLALPDLPVESRGAQRTGRGNNGSPPLGAAGSK